MPTSHSVLAPRARRVYAIAALATVAACAGDPTGPASVAVLSDAQLARAVGDVQVIDLGILAGTQAEARAVNDAGDAVGWSNAPGTISQAVMWRHGQTTPVPLGPTTVLSAAMGIDRSGEIVGYYQTPGTGPVRSFIWRDGQVTDLGSLGDGAVIAWAINDHSQVVGLAESVGQSHVFLWENGQMRDLGGLGGPFAFGTSVNKRGDVVGAASAPSGNEDPFLYRDGQMTDLGSLGGLGGIAFSINASRQIVGYKITSTFDERAFLWQDGKIVDIGALPGHDHSWARWINDHGDIVGQSWSGVNRGLPRPVLWTNGTVRDLGTLPGGSYGAAIAINDKGVIVGFSQAADGRQHAAMWVTRGKAP